MYVIYWKGPVLRKRSPFAQQLSQARQDTDGRRLSYVPSKEGRRASRPSVAGERRRSSWARSQQDLRVREATGSRRNSRARQQTGFGSRPGSRPNSVAATAVENRV